MSLVSGTLPTTWLPNTNYQRDLDCFHAPNPNTRSSTLNERSGIQDAMLQQVPYDFNGAIVQVHTSFQHHSLKKTVAEILESKDTETYYTIQGMVLKPKVE